MFQFLIEVLVQVAVEGLWHAILRASQGNARHKQEWPYDWKNRFDDPVYKKNLQRLIERNRRLEETRE
jgi:hypothetical protein